MSRRGTRGSRRVTVLAATLLSVAVGAGTLAGCSTNDEPEPQAQEQQQPDSSDKSDESPTPSESPTPGERDLPAKLDHAPVHVVLDYFDAWHAALKTGDTEAFMRYATENCEGCRGMAKTIEEAYSKGGRLDIEHFEPVLDSERNLFRQSSSKNATVIIHYDEGKATIVPKQGAAPETHPARHTDQHATMIREGNKWMIEELHVETVKE